MTNYLEIMDVQQWQMRPEMVAKLKAGVPNDSVIESVSKTEAEPVTNDDNILVSQEKLEHANLEQINNAEKATEVHASAIKLDVNNVVSEQVVASELAPEVTSAEEAHDNSGNKIENLVKVDDPQDQEKLSELSQVPKPLNPVSVSGEDDVKQAEFFVYAATTLRQYGNQQKRWLWVVDQVSLSREELKLLDNIVMATESEWEESGLADGYMGDDQLQSLLSDEVSEVVLFGASHAEFFVNKRVFVTSSIGQLVSDGDKKRQTWQGLKQLMQ